MAEADSSDRCELTIFQCKELYIYKVPPASTIGHRAESWGVDKWLQEVSMKVVTQGEDCRIKLYDLKTGSFYAECPVPKPEVAPLSTAVDPVVDSSRYFVLKLEDSTTKRHAFIGIGFREREQASDFNASLAEHIQYVRRAREAEQMREAFASDRAAEGAGSAPQGPDLSLKPGETIRIKLGKVNLGSKLGLKNTQSAGGSESGKPSKLLPPPSIPPPSTGGSGGTAPLKSSPGTKAGQRDDWSEFVS